MNEDISAFLMSVVWQGTCGRDDSRDIKARVDSPTGAACGHYQLHLRFELDDERECP